MRDQALNEMLGATYANDFAGEYGNVFGDARALFSELKPNLGVAPYNVTATFPNTGLGKQLQRVAEVIKLSRRKKLCDAADILRAARRFRPAFGNDVEHGR